MKPYGPYTLSANTLQPVITDQSPNAGTAVFLNESPFTLKIVDEANGNYFVVSAYTQDKMLLGDWYSGRLSVTPVQDLTFSGANPALKLYVMIYSKGEPVPGQYPMSLSRLASIANQVGSGQTFDAILEASASVDCTIGTFQSFALTPQGLNLAGVSPTTPGYLVLGYLDTDAGHQVKVDTQGNKEAAYLTQNIVVPNGGNVQEFSLPSPANWLTGIQIRPNNASASLIEVKRLQDPVGSYVVVSASGLPGVTGSPTFLDLTTHAFSPDGFTNFAGNGGISVRVTNANTSGASQTYTVIFYGYTYAYDEVYVQISYVDWLNNQYDLGVARVGALKTLPINFLVPIPITDPAQTNFGSIAFQAFSSHLFYNTHYTFDVYIPCFVSQLAPV